MNNELHFHFIGIGGIGISALAFLYLKKGYRVSGSDLKKSEITQALKKQGAKIFIGHKTINLKNPDLVIYSSAVPKNNPELKKAQKQKIKCQTYAQALAKFAQDYFLIAISGTHGKTTTSSMIAQILLKANFDPSYVIGKKNGWHLGKSKYLVIEADEYKDSFLNYHPDLAIITNVDADHLDYFKNLPNIKKSFYQFKKQSKKIIKYKKRKINLQIPGKHNLYNACLAFETAKTLGIKNNIIKKALFEYKGSWRRFEEHKLKIRNHKLKIIHDYAHHPTEIQATLQATREKYPKKQIIAIFQPHQYHRLNALFDQFSKAFQLADRVIITDVFAVSGREEKIQKTSQDLAKAIKNAEYIKLNKLADFIKKNAKPNQVVLFMGAGDIYDVKL